MSDKKETGKDLRDQLERRNEILKHLSELGRDFTWRPDIPVSLWRLLIRRGLRPQRLDVPPVNAVCGVYNLCEAPLISLIIEVDGSPRWYTCFYKNRLLRQFDAQRPSSLLVAQDGHVVCCECLNGETRYFQVLPDSDEPILEPFLVSSDESLTITAFEEGFFKKHGGQASPWISPMFTSDGKNDLIHISGHIPQSVELSSGPIGDLQIGIIRCNKELYKVILGWADDYRNNTEE